MSSPPRVLRASVRRLAELLHRTGDLHFLYDAAVLPDEGQQAHRRLAERLGGEAEVRVAHRVTCDGYTLRLAGRIDLLQRVAAPTRSRAADVAASGTGLRVCEFKSTRSDIARLHEHWASVHWAQVGLYAAMLLAAGRGSGSVEGGSAVHDATSTAQVTGEVELALHYVHVDTGAEQVFRRRASHAELIALLEDTCARWIERARARDAWRGIRNASLEALQFPHAHFRPRQRALAAAAFRAHRVGTTLLCEAPTGLGKTLAFVFPGFKAMAGGHTSRLLYLTARGTGQRSALDALSTLQDRGARLRQVQILARDKVCLTPGAACTGDACAYARGYHDREGIALAAVRALPMAHPDAVLAIARDQVVCPFALSLTFAREADVVVCDYNYVLDPFVRSARLLADEARHTTVLIDEVHQLPERAQEMHSASLRAASFRDAAVGAPRGTRTLLRDLAAEVDALRQRASAAGGVLPENLRPTGDGEKVVGIAQEEGDLAGHVVAESATAGTLDALARRLVDRALPLLAADASAAFRAACLAASAWLAVGAFAPRAPYALCTRDDGVLQRLCIDASALVAETLAGFRSVQAFSATLPGGADAPPLGLPTPLEHWQVPAVFPAAHMGTFVVTDLDVTMKARVATAQAVAAAIRATASARRGNYLVFLPSFAYLALIAAAFVDAAGSRGSDAFVHLVQQRGSDDAARAAFLACFRDDGEARVGFAVTGGLFGESVDLPGAALIGVIIVGVALAPPAPERDLLRTHLGTRGDAHADAAAYDIPAMVRVRQTAGRLIRTPEDRGVLVLIDPRFAQPRFRRWLPEHWQLRPLGVAALGPALADFWATTAVSGSLLSGDPLSGNPLSSDPGSMGTGNIAHPA